MRKRAIWVFVGLCVAIATVWFARKDNLPAVRLPEGETLRVLDVTIGTNITFSVEPFWKQALRAVAPASLGIKVFGQSRGYTTTADYETLAVLMDPLPGKRRTIRVETVFPDGTVKSAIGGWAPNYRSPILFRSYPREESQIDLRFWITSNDVVSLRLKNKRVASREKWTTGTLPQTNLIQETEVVLKEWRFPYGSDAGELMLAARSTTDSGVGWLRWQTTLLDSTGNWSTDPQNRRPFLPGARSEGVFKLLAEGNEYISGGFFGVPTNSQYHVVRVAARMTNWGVRFAALFGPGTYEITKIFEIKARTGVVVTNSLKVARSSWLVECVQPVTFCISERTVSDVRLRERLPHDKGQIFYGRPTTTVSKEDITAQLFTPHLRPTVTNILEAEVVVRWPTVEFFVQRPEP